MQAQNIQTQNTISLKESQAYVETLLSTSLASITFLRQLFSAENFAFASLASEDRSNSFSKSRNGGLLTDDRRNNPSAFKVTTLMRGFTEEADRLLDYLEIGIFDALRRQYLKSFIFAIYLNQKDPNNVVEAYTFNFTYHNVPGTNFAVPVVSFEEKFKKQSLFEFSDPAFAASKNGKRPTLGETKKSVKAMLRRLIQATGQMDPLPVHRYATFKLFYHSHTPPDYEPPHFRSGDADQDKWYFATHGRDEAPEKWSIGSLETPFHSVDLHIASVVSHIPSMDDNNAPFTGTITASSRMHPPLSSAEELAAKMKQITLQMKDAEDRNIVWNAEDGLCDEDAEGIPDEEYLAKLKTCGQAEEHGAWAADALGTPVTEPIGIRNERGEIEPLPSRSQFQIRGSQESVPPRVGLMKKTTEADTLAQTQEIPLTQPQYPSADGMERTFTKSAPSLPNDRRKAPPVDHASKRKNIDTQSLMRDMIVDEDIDTEMLDMETQRVAGSVDPIQSFEGNMDGSAPATQVAKPMIESMIKESISCECHVDIEDDSCLCEGGCGRWYHLWCMGYHSTRDKRIPKVFICFDCRIRGDQNWPMLKDEAYPQMLQKFQDLALFRRAIKVAELNNGPENVTKFAKLIGCETGVAAALFKRLESEGFIAPEFLTTDQYGILETRTRAIKGKGKGKGKQRKSIQKTRYSFVSMSRKQKAYSDYFSPLSQVEKELMGLADVEATFRQRWKMMRGQTAAKHAVEDGQAAPGDTHKARVLETALALPAPESQVTIQPTVTRVSTSIPHAELKRKPTGISAPNKKIKISVATAIDLQD